MTLEEAQNRILELEQELESTKTERDALSRDKDKLATDLEKARTLNQRLFERVTQSNTPAPKDDEPDDVPSCEEFAKTIIF